ncbi:MAG: cupin domain-containing protein [Gammaproteobacteria bacterium]
MSTPRPKAAAAVAARRGQSIYPAPFAPLVAGRTKRKLGDAFGLGSFGVNLTELEPGAVSALMHYHAVQDEFIYVLAGRPTLRIGSERHSLEPGDCCGFPAGEAVPPQLVNETRETVVYLEVGDRLPGDTAEFPHDDLAANLGADGRWRFTRKDGSDY